MTPLLIVTLPYLLILVLVAGIVGVRLLFLRKQRDMSNEKIQFFIDTAHDIRTPLMLIKAPLEELQTNEKLSPQGRANLETSLRNVNTLMRLTINLTNFERASMQSATLNRTACELSAYFDEMLSVFRPYAEIMDIKLVYESNFEHFNAYVDREKMESILKNLLSNALKYTPAGGSVSVRVTAGKQEWSVEVCDTGIGIPSAQQKKLFRQHYRGSNGVNARVGGGGIGLLLVGKQIEQHQGKLSFSSSEKRGTCIRIVFPIGEEDKQQHEALDWKFLAAVNQQIEAHMADSSFNVETLSSLLNMSRTSFYNKLKAVTDDAPADYIRHIRLERAAQLLGEQRYSVTEVSELTGFNDAKYFREVFKKHFGISPSQYVKQEERTQ